MLLLGATLGFLGNFWRQVQHQRRAVALIEGAGGRVRYSYEFDFEDDRVDLDDAHQEYANTYYGFTDDGIRLRKRTTASGTVIEYETPPGPKFIRRLLGDKTFASVDLINLWEANLDDPPNLSHLPELKVVWLSGQQVSDGWLRQCARAPKLKELHLFGGSVATATADGMSQLRSARNLEHLSLYGDSVNDETLTGVADLPQLKALWLFDTPQVTSAMFANLKGLQELRSLNIIRAKGIDDDGTENLAALPNLRSLWLMQTSVGDGAMDHVGKLKNLRQLDLTDTQVGDAGIQALAGLTRLRFLKLSGTKISDASVPVIAGLTELEWLSLPYSVLGEESLLQLKPLKKLKNLLVGLFVPEEGLKALQAELPQCRITVIDLKGGGRIYKSDP